MSDSSDSDFLPRRAASTRLDNADLPLEAARLLARVAATNVPILCLDCFGPAFARVAALIHGESHRDRLILVDLRSTREAMLAGLIRANSSPRATIAVDGIELLDRDAQAAFFRSMERDAPRLISASLASLDELRETCRPEFFAFATTVTVCVPALARRGASIGAVAERRLERLCGDLGRPAPRLSSAAVDALAGHSWPGDVAELDAVLTRTLLVAEGDSIEPTDLRWSPGEEPHPRPAAPPQAGSSPSEATEPAPADERSVAPGARVEGGTAAEGQDREAGDEVSTEALAVELAHQLKNPLVTVKTFVQNVAHLATDPTDLARFRDLTDDAISRMDEALEELLAFARLGPARRTHLEAVALLRDALRDASGAFTSKEITVAGPPAAALHVLGDPEHLRVAFNTLARHLLESIEPRAALTVGVDPPGVLTLCYRESGPATHLRGVTGLARGSFPLALLLVRGALARAGSRLDVTRDGDQVRVALRFATA